MGSRINTVMQPCFFAARRACCRRDEAIARDQGSRSRRPTASAGEAIVERNFAAIDASLARLHQVDGPGRRRPASATGAPTVPDDAPDFVAAGHRA